MKNALLILLVTFSLFILGCESCGNGEIPPPVEDTTGAPIDTLVGDTNDVDTILIND